MALERERSRGCECQRMESNGHCHYKISVELTMMTFDVVKAEGMSSLDWSPSVVASA